MQNIICYFQLNSRTTDGNVLTGKWPDAVSLLKQTDQNEWKLIETLNETDSHTDQRSIKCLQMKRSPQGAHPHSCYTNMDLVRGKYRNIYHRCWYIGRTVLIKRAQRAALLVFRWTPSEKRRRETSSDVSHADIIDTSSSTPQRTPHPSSNWIFSIIIC